MLCQMARLVLMLLFFFFNDTATTEIYTLSLHDALPIYLRDLESSFKVSLAVIADPTVSGQQSFIIERGRSEEHTSELQSPDHLVCRLLLENKSRTRCTPQQPLLSTPTYTEVLPHDASLF